MTPEIQALAQQLSNNPLSTYYAGQLLSSTDDRIGDELAGIIRGHVERYTAAPQILSAGGGAEDIGTRLQAIFDFFPTAFFIFSNDLHQDLAHFKCAKLLQITGIAACLTRDPSRNAHIEQFFASIDPNDTLEDLTRKTTDSIGDSAYLPWILQADFVQVRKKYRNLVVTKNIHELIDMIFCFQGLMQVFLKYYFDMICAAPSAIAGLHIDRIFSGLFAALRYQEIKYWGHYSDGRKLQGELFHLIRMDAPSNRHPVLRKHIFDSLKHHHPIIKDARSRYTLPDIRQTHQRQLLQFQKLPVPCLAVLLDTVLLCKGKSHLVYLLSQVLKNTGRKLFELQRYIKGNTVREFTPELTELVSYFVQKLSSTQQRANIGSSRQAEANVVIQTTESLRKAKAKQLIKDREAKSGLTFDQLSRFMQEKLKKVHQRVKTESSITQNRIDGHLGRFTNMAQLVLNRTEDGPTTQVISEFQTAAEQLTADIINLGHLNAEQAEVFTRSIQEQTRQLESADLNQQAEIIEQIGLLIAEASIQSDATQQQKTVRIAPTTAARPKALTYDQVSRFLEKRLQRLYEKVRIEGALTQDKVSDYLSRFTRSAHTVINEIPPEKKTETLNRFIVSVEEILNGFSTKGSLPSETVDQYRTEIRAITSQLNTASVEQRTQMVEKIGLALTQVSLESKQWEKTTLPPRNGRKSNTRLPVLTQDEIPAFLENYLQRLYAKAKKDGALTQDQVSQYLSQFANAARQIVIELPVAERQKAIHEFKISTDDILKDLSRQKQISHQHMETIRLEVGMKTKALDTDDLQERIQVVDQIGLVIADALSLPQKPTKPLLDEVFLKKELIPYGTDNTAKMVSVGDFFSFPFGERKGPTDNDWFNYHIRYLDMIHQSNKISPSDFQKISEIVPLLPKVKYRKYFNIFPNDQFEETTFLAVLDLWQNKALESLKLDS
jgi:hypothetical protein